MQHVECKQNVVRRRGGHMSNAIALVAAAMFVMIGSQVLPQALGMSSAGGHFAEGLVPAFLLNIALLLFAWRRSVELRGSSAAREEAERRAHELAYKDDTTGLFNRRYLVDRLHALSEARGEKLTLLLIDLDHFKKVNDLYGHAAGDTLLREIGSRIRDVAPSEACCARLGGDEFAILLSGASAHDSAATALAELLLDQLSRPVRLDGPITTVGASIGLSSMDESCRRPEALLRRSDIAMYQAKATGRNCFVWFDLEMGRELERRNVLEAEMRESLAERRFMPYFQPLMDLETGEVKGFEVLARWNHPTRGIVEPNEFIPIAESSGMISELSFTVMHDALIHAREWPNHMTIAVNISPVQFKDPLLAQRIVKILTATGFPPHRLELELTESTLLDDREVALATVESLKNYGIRISLDDFGTGYASLSQLRALPFDRIKIDKSFVASLLDDQQSNAIVHAIATLGRNLDLPITAEGVESAGVQKRLINLGCSDAQGWLYGKALPADETAKLFLGIDLAPPVAQAPLDLGLSAPKERRDFKRRAC